MNKAFDKIHSGPERHIARWVEDRIGIPHETFKTFNSLWFEDDRGVKVALIYNNFDHPSICIHVAARPGALWCRPEILHHIFYYPFQQLDCRLLLAPVRESNMASRKTVEALGFSLDGRLRKMDDEKDVLLYGMLREECRWVNELAKAA